MRKFLSQVILGFPKNKSNNSIKNLEQENKALKKRVKYLEEKINYMVSFAEDTGILYADDVFSIFIDEIYKD